MDKIQKINAEHYDRNAERWSAHHTNSFWHEANFRKFIKYFRLGDKIIDIGSASGIHVPLSLGIGEKLCYEGFDISKKLIKIAKSRYPKLKFHRGDILDSKTFPKIKYDGFWAAAVLQHVPIRDLPKALGNIEKITKLGAVGYVTVPVKRPNPESKKDRRHFEFFKSGQKFRRIITPRNWKILASGKLVGGTGHATWRWYLVRLP